MIKIQVLNLIHDRRAPNPDQVWSVSAYNGSPDCRMSNVAIEELDLCGEGVGKRNTALDAIASQQ